MKKRMMKMAPLDEDEGRRQGRKVPCVAINPDGSVAMRFATLRKAAKTLGVTAGLARKMLLSNEDKNGYKLLSELTYKKLNDGGKLYLVTWASKPQPKRKKIPSSFSVFGARIAGNYFKQFFATIRHHADVLIGAYQVYIGGIMTPFDIADYYDNPMDKEIALFLCLCITKMMSMKR